MMGFCAIFSATIKHPSLTVTHAICLCTRHVSVFIVVHQCYFNNVSAASAFAFPLLALFFGRLLVGWIHCVLYKPCVVCAQCTYGATSGPMDERLGSYCTLVDVQASCTTHDDG